MDADLVHAEIALLEARIAEEEGALADFEREILAAVARLDTDVSVAAARLEEVRTLQAQRDAEARELRLELARREALLSRQLADPADVHEVRLRLVALEAMLDAFPALEVLHADRLQAALSLRQDLQGAMNIGDDHGVQEALAQKANARRHILDAERERLLRELSLYEIRATSGGIVTEIYRQPGAIVMSGEEILRLVPEAPPTVDAFLPVSMLGAVQTGQAVRIIRKRPRETFAGQVVFISPEVRTLSENAGFLRGQPIRGQRVVIHFTEAADPLIPGEEVLVRPAGFFGGSGL
jgi:multidrug resistance efflux pump